MIRHAVRVAPALLVMLLTALSGCAQTGSMLLSAPPMNPVGSGISQPVAMRIPGFMTENAVGGEAHPFEGSAADLFRDRRAKQPGDVVTVTISIDDKASLNSNISRSKESSIGSSLDVALDWLGLAHEGSAGLNASTDSSANGKGSISRSERIELSVAALVTDRLANGHLVISGTQEVRINNEVRELTVAGIVDPLHVTSDNTIAYDKIAEARISYGGRGRVSDVQQPGFGQQLFDKYAPF